MTIPQLIEALADKLTPENYAKHQQLFDDLAWMITVEAMDKKNCEENRVEH